jgi:hypothetical protein
MIALKDALFGSSGPDLVSIGQWPKDDVFRLKALLKVEPRALDYGHMQVAARLAAAPDPAEIASDVQWHEIGASTRRQLIEDLSRSVSSRLVVEIALATPVATDLLSLRPDAWGEPALWVPNDVEIVHRLLSSAGKEERSLTLRRLVERHDLHAAAHVTELDPTLWWGLVGTEPFAKTLTKDLEAARTARRLVEQFGSEQIGPPDSPLTSNTQLRALNAAAPADAQLWRFVASDQWVDVASELTDGPTEQVLGRDELCQLLIVVLAAGHQDRDPNLRERAWRTVFGRLHGLLAQVDPPDGATWSLDILLPAGRRLDWCGRLREGLALAAVTDNWQMETLAGIAAGAPDFASEIEARAALIRERMHQSLLEAIVRFFRPND